MKDNNKVGYNISQNRCQKPVFGLTNNIYILKGSWAQPEATGIIGRQIAD